MAIEVGNPRRKSVAFSFGEAVLGCCGENTSQPALPVLVGFPCALHHPVGEIIGALLKRSAEVMDVLGKPDVVRIVVNGEMLENEVVVARSDAGQRRLDGI